MKPELTQSRTCRDCGRALPLNLRIDAIYCPARRGERRCGSATKKRLISQLEPWERSSIQERETIQTHMLPGTIGYRISIVLDDSLYIFPKMGAKYHYNAYGQRIKGGYFTFGELARIPITALYKIEYVGSDGGIIVGEPRFLHLTKTPLGRLRARPNPTARRVLAASLVGDPETDSVRLYQLASHLGVSTVELYPILTACGINARRHARSSVSRQECDKIVKAFQSAAGSIKTAGIEETPDAKSARQAGPHERTDAGAQPMMIMSAPAVLDEEFRIIERTITRAQQDLSDTTAASVKMIDSAMEHAASVVDEADKLTGLSFASRPARTMEELEKKLN